VTRQSGPLRDTPYSGGVMSRLRVWAPVGWAMLREVQVLLGIPMIVTGVTTRDTLHLSQQP